MPSLTQVQCEVGGTIPTVAYGNFQIKISVVATLEAGENEQVAIAGVMEQARAAMAKQVYQSCTEELFALAANWSAEKYFNSQRPPMTLHRCLLLATDQSKVMSWYMSVDSERARALVAEHVWPIFENKIAAYKAQQEDQEAQRLAIIAQQEAEDAANAENTDKSSVLVVPDYPPENDPDNLIVRNPAPATDIDEIPF